MTNNFSQSYRDPNEVLPQKSIDDCAESILAVARQLSPTPVPNLEILDVGCGSGRYAFALAREVKRVVGIEPDIVAFNQARRSLPSGPGNVSFVHGFVEEVQLQGLFDIAVSLNTIEHMPRAEDSFKAILEQLRPGGLIYVTAPNLLWPIECHYHLPFLSWLPLPAANLYLRLAGKGRSYEDCSYMRSYWGLKRLFHRLGCDIQFVLPDENSNYLGAGDNRWWARTIRVFGIRLIRRFPIFWAISKGFMFVVRKTS